MKKTSWLRSGATALAAGAGVAAAVYGARAAVNWYRYGSPSRGTDRERDDLLDRFIPVYDVVERHQIEIAAPADVTLLAACEQDLLQLPLIRTIFKAREVAMGARPADAALPSGLLASTLALGWGVLADVPGRQIVVGAVTRPWEADVHFRAGPPDEFAAFWQPGLVKIVWTLRADPIDETTSLFRTETRAVATDRDARDRFRRYWAFASPGIGLIRTLSLHPLKRDAERRADAVLA
jgi:hypothetical protein